MPGCEDGRITQENLQKIRTGMTLAEVEAILGPGRDDTSGAGMGISGGGIATSSGPQDKVYVWQDGAARIVIIFVKGKAESIQHSGF
jgi:hypothetical protein